MAGGSLDQAALRDEFKRTALAFLKQLQHLQPPETPYALLFEISDQQPSAWPIGATEESLTRMAAQYQQKGYRARSGDDVALLRVALRWDAPGDDVGGWYWGDDETHKKLNSLLAQHFAGSYENEDEDDESGYLAVQRVCLQALQELDQAGAFGTGQAREQFVIGISNVDNDFESFLDELAEVNPPAVIARLETQLSQRNAAWDEIASP